ncbi:VPS10 domain-containing protein [Labilibacter marinus]|uniref:VPS10 domain-containing protein n=1 Tax=Labilibacter marinus TaxID=1477105 RepID=UPI00094F9232|nr:sialidase family protein [Labilibacter marinus]
MIRLTLSAIIILLCLTLHAQIDKAYFNTLHTKQVESSDLVEWRQVGPGMSGYCEEFWCHPTDPNVIMMSPDMYNTYGSWDAGKSWHTMKDCDGIGKDLARVRKFEFSHQNPAFGYAITGSGTLFITKDTGKSWKETYKFKGRSADIVVDPSNDNNWYVGPGDFWNVKANHRFKDGQTRNFKNNGIYKSTNKGKTWNKVIIGDFENLDVGRIAIAPTDSKVIIAATSKGLFRSTNQGKTWKSSAQGLPVNRPRDLDYFYDTDSKEFILYLLEQTAFEADRKTVSVQGGVFKSTDHGASWQNISGNLAVDMNEISSNILRNKYWNSLAFWFQSNTKSIQQKHPELPTKAFDVWHRIQVNPLNKNEIYLSHNNKHDKSFLPGGAWKSNDGGKTWIAAAREGKYWIEGKDNAYWKSRNNPIGTNTTFAHLQPEMDRREETWGNRFLELSIDGTAYICLDQQVLQSKNGGKSWEQIDDNETEPGCNHWVGRGDSNLPGRLMLLETGKKDRYLMCSGEHGLWQTAPLGNYPDKMAVAVEQLDGQIHHGGSHSASSVAIHPQNPDIIYFLSYRQENRGKLRKSIDGGKTWKNISTIFDADVPMHQRLVFQNSLIIDPITPDNMYFCATRNPISEVAGPYAKKLTKGDYGFYRSTDGGKNWELSNNGFHANVSIRRVMMDPKNPAILYAAANDKNGALYKSIDKGLNWKKVNIPSTIQSVNNVYVDRNNQHIYISCGNEQATDAGGGAWRSKDGGKKWEKIFDLPFIWQCEPSPINPDIITVCAALPPKTKDANKRLNPGAYVSMDGGKTWNKINNNLGQQDRIVDFKPDPYREDIFWSSQKGSGWAIGYLKGTKNGWSEK